MTNKQVLEYLFELTKGYTWYFDTDCNALYLNTTTHGMNSLTIILNGSKLDFTSVLRDSLQLHRIEIKLEDVINHKAKLRDDKINQILDEE